MILSANFSADLSLNPDKLSISSLVSPRQSATALKLEAFSARGFFSNK